VYGRRREINTHWDLFIGIRNHLGESATGQLARYDVNNDGNIDLRDLTKARIPPELPSYQPWGFQGRIRCSYKTSGASPQTVTVYDFRARFYDPTHGRFMQRDPAEYADSYNLYWAFLGNPLIGTDPTGAWTYMELLTSSASMVWQAYTAYSTVKTAAALAKDIANAWEARNLTLEAVCNIAAGAGELGLDYLTGPGSKLLSKFAGATVKSLREVGQHRAQVKAVIRTTMEGADVVVHKHHLVPVAVLNRLKDTPGLRKVYDALLDKKDNIFEIPEDLHKFLHSRGQLGGWWNRMWNDAVTDMINRKLKPEEMIAELKQIRQHVLTILAIFRT